MVPRPKSLAACAAVATLLAVTPAGANGRFPASVNIRFHPTDTNKFLLPSTFGLLTTSDGGATFQWVCENTIGYGGTYDPDYAFTSNGDIFATTFDGLRVSRDGACTFTTIGAPLANQWVGEVEVGPDDKIWAVTSTGGQPNDVYVSTNGTDFTSTGISLQDVWWKSIRIAPGDADRAYLSGFKVQVTLPDAGVDPPDALLYKTIDGGANWTPLPTTDFTFGASPQLYVLGVSPTDPDVVFARVVAANPPVGDALYRSADAGANWTKVLDMDDAIAGFVIRSDGTTVIAGSVNPCPGDQPDDPKGCVQISTDSGVTFQDATTQPKMACLGERSDGMLFSCGANWEPDFFAVGSSSDAATWTAVMRFADIAGPLECQAGTEQAECASLVWPSLCEMLGICSAVDAGANSGMGQLGETCTDNTDCESNMCYASGGEQRCSQACTTGGATCPSDYECLNDTACWPAEKKGCSCSAGGIGGIFLFLLPFMGRRRRRRPTGV